MMEALTDQVYSIARSLFDEVEEMGRVANANVAGVSKFKIEECAARRASRAGASGGDSPHIENFSSVEYKSKAVFECDRGNWNTFCEKKLFSYRQPLKKFRFAKSSLLCMFMQQSRLNFSLFFH